MSVSRDEIKHIGKLARIEIKEEQYDKLARDMSGIVDMVNKLSDLDLSDVSVPLPEKINAWREDKVMESYDRDELLKNAPSKMAGCYLVPKVVE
ncbi:MAG: Asp-tRNA(Asn)/Glu-tRNA(Gln) amidotransferase subunit GatC [Bacillota bacterium]|nr:Asp-tRNA(Asn)/Glu-tRNA(Gln) amidotransferase subunit GatC [Bacillota bacterium]